MRYDDFADFYEMDFEKVSIAVAAYCGDADVAHEATQEAFARCFARWGKLKEEPWRAGWVTTTAINLSRRHFKGRLARIEVPQEPASPGPGVDHVDLVAQLRPLPDRQRQAVVLHYLIDLPVAEVADLMSLSVGAVTSHLHKARASLRLTMEASHG